MTRLLVFPFSGFLSRSHALRGNAVFDALRLNLIRIGGSSLAELEKTESIREAETNGAKPIAPKSLRLFYHADGKPRLIIENDRCYLSVKAIYAAPLSYPNHYISLIDEKGEEITMIRSVDALDEETRIVILKELSRRYCGALIQKIHSIRSEFGVSYWDVQTDRGRREFVVEENPNQFIWLSDTRLLILDVDSNRFEIPDYTRLDARSAKLMVHLT